MAVCRGRIMSPAATPFALEIRFPQNLRNLRFEGRLRKERRLHFCASFFFSVRSVQGSFLKQYAHSDWEGGTFLSLFF